MRTCKEMRQDAWKIATGTTWIWKIAANYIVLMAIFAGAMIALSFAYEAAGVQTWEAFQESAREARRAGIEMAVPSAHEACRMTLASTFSVFVQYLFSGIMAFGIVTTLVKCVRNETAGWFADAFGGFRRPLEMLWLTVLIVIRIFLWTLLFVIPGLVAAFRYMLAWYVKAENPEMGAAACLKRSGELMAGRKWKFFVFSLSYLGWYFLAIVPVLLATGVVAAVLQKLAGETASTLAVVVGVLVCLPLVAFVTIYSVIGKAIFYRDAKAECEPAPAPAIA